MKNLITLLLIALFIASCGNSNQKELADLREENAELKKMLEDNAISQDGSQMKTLSAEMTSAQSGPSSVGKLIPDTTFNSSKQKYKVWKGEAKKGSDKVKYGLYPDYFFIGLEKMKYMVDNSYLYNAGKDSTKTIKGFALTMGLKYNSKKDYIFDLMIVPEIDSANFILINPPASDMPKGSGSFGDGSILDDSKPCPNNCGND